MQHRHSRQWPARSASSERQLYFRCRSSVVRPTPSSGRGEAGRSAFADEVEFELGERCRDRPSRSSRHTTRASPDRRCENRSSSYGRAVVAPAGGLGPDPQAPCGLQRGALRIEDLIGRRDPRIQRGNLSGVITARADQPGPSSGYRIRNSRRLVSGFRQRRSTVYLGTDLSSSARRDL